VKALPYRSMNLPRKGRGAPRLGQSKLAKAGRLPP
jgi:hypothetical protein